MARIETTIISNLLYDEDYTRKVIPFIKKEYFSDRSEALLVEEILAFYSDYNKPTTKEILEIQISNRMGLGAPDVIEAHRILEALDQTEINVDWLIRETESFVKERAVYNSIMASIRIIEGKDDKYTPEAIPSLLSEALGITFDSSVGHDYLEDSDARFEQYRSAEEKLPFDIEILNKITNGGLTRKSLNIIMAGTGCGKSLFLCHTAASSLTQNRNVLYITLEMSENKIAERIDANLLNLGMQELKTVEYSIFNSRVQKLKKKSMGRLIVKEYPTGSAHVGHFRALLEELKLKKNFMPDLIVIDYLNICASQRMKMGNSVNSYTYIKAIAEELRGLGVEYNVPILSATQSNRGNQNSSDMELSDTSESFGLPMSADLFLGLIATDELTELDQIMIKQLKNRYNDVNYYNKFVVGIDRNKMRIFDAENSAQVGIIPQQSTSYASAKPKIDTSDFIF